MQDSFWFTTRSRLFEAGDGAWQEVARYDQPLRRLLARRYAHCLSVEERDDLVQNTLIEIKEKLSSRFDASRGRFRALIQTVVARRVTDELRRARTRSLPPGLEETLAAPLPEDLEALDLEAALVQAVAACRDHFSGGSSKDLAVLHALSGRLVHGRSTVRIAEQEGLSRDQVSRLLIKGRDVIFAILLADQLGLSPSGPESEACVTAFKRMLRKPTDSRAALAGLNDPELAESLDDFWSRFRAALPRFEGDVTAAGRELAQGVGLILEAPA